MVKRYDGNTGRVTHVEERRPGPPPREPARPRPMPAAPGRRPQQSPAQRGFAGGLPIQLQRLLSGAVGDLETEDLLLLLILYLLYRESGDRDWLLTLGAVLFL